MRSNTLTPMVALSVVVGAVGFMAGRFSSPGSTDAASERSAGTSDTRAGSSFRSTGSSDTPGSQRPSLAKRAATPENLARLTAILRSEDPLYRNRGLFTFIDRLDPADFETAADHFRSLGLTGSRAGEYALLLSAWAKRDPHAALAFARAHPDDKVAATTVLATWASSDPDAALRWAIASHEGTGPNPFLAGVIRGIAETDPEHAAKLLADMPPGNERYEALNGVLPQLLAQGTDVARAWIEGLADVSLREAAMKFLANDLATVDPAGTAEWLQANPSEATARRMGDVYGKWARVDERAAIDSVTSLPAGEARSNALSGVVGAMATTDPQAALSLMDRLNDDGNPQVMKNFLWNSLEKDPALAAAQIPRIQDAATRDWWYSHILGSWLNRDAAAANAWIKDNPLPQPVIDQLANRPATPR
jgi:hypothetical protein